MVSVEALVKDLGGRRVVDGVSFSVGAGEIYGLIGPNGAGKTTTFRVIAGLMRPTAGTVRVDGIDVAASPDRAKARLGFS
jgi:ABC-2 type transport system ATP-binding protein